ncbi:MAG: phosphoribosylanthranilate isomerase, partial [Nonlabens sp.]
MMIKVCGMRDIENINQLQELDIDFMGLIRYP